MIVSALYSGAKPSACTNRRAHKAEVHVLGIAAWILGILAWLVIVVDAFKRHTLDGLLCLIIPFYSLFHLFFRQETHKGLAMVLFFSSIGLGVAARGDFFSSNGPCDLADKAQVEEAFGEKFEKASSSSTRLGEACLYSASGSPERVLSVVLVPECPEDLLKETSETRSRFRVSEVGDAAMSSGADLYVQKGKTCLVLRYTAGDQDSQSSLQARKRVAQLLLTKLKP